MRRLSNSYLVVGDIDFLGHIDDKRFPDSAIRREMDKSCA
jgi:hypothetical protein